MSEHLTLTEKCMAVAEGILFGATLTIAVVVPIMMLLGPKTPNIPNPNYIDVIDFLSKGQICNSYCRCYEMLSREV